MRTANLRRLLGAIWNDPIGRRWLLLSQAALLGQVVFDLLIPLAIRQIVNNGILAGNFDKVIEGSLYMAVFAVASMLFATACAWYAAQARRGGRPPHGVRLYRRITELSWGNVDRLETSDLLVRLTTDINQVRVMTTSSVTTLLRAPLMIVGAILDPALGRRPARAGDARVPAGRDRRAGLLPAARARRSTGRCSPASTGSTRCCRRTWRASGSCRRSSAPTTRTTASSARTTELQDAATAAQSSAAFLNPALLLVINLGLAGALWVGGDLVIDGKIELGSVFVLLNYLVAVMIPLILLSVLLPQMASADSSVGRVLEVLEEQPDVQDKPDAPSLAEAAGGEVKGRVAFEGVSFSYLGADGKPNPSRCSATSTSSPSRDRWSRSSARPARASRRS